MSINARRSLASGGRLKGTESVSTTPPIERPMMIDRPGCGCREDASPATTFVVDQEKIRMAVRDILIAVGEDPDREGLLETPDRVARMYTEIFSGLHQDARVHLTKTFTVKHDEMVLQKDIEFSSMCEHHLLPFMGKVHIAYLPSGKVVGLSKLARIVEVVSHKPQVQERMTEELADLVMNELDARGAAVIVEAGHTCMSIRGVRKTGSTCVTSAMRGMFQSNPPLRNEMHSLVFSRRA